MTCAVCAEGAPGRCECELDPKEVLANIDEALRKTGRRHGRWDGLYDEGPDPLTRREAEG